MELRELTMPKQLLMLINAMDRLKEANISKYFQNLSNTLHEFDSLVLADVPASSQSLTVKQIVIWIETY
jgi:hypothetical protein